MKLIKQSLSVDQLIFNGVVEQTDSQTCFHNLIILLLLGKSVWIQERLKTQSGEESSSSGRFNPMGPLQQSRCLGSYPP